MAISRSSVQGGPTGANSQRGSSFAEQMGGLLQNFQQLQQTQQELNRLQRDQNAKRVMPLLEERARKYGGVRNMLQTEEGRDLFRLGIGQTTEFTPTQVDDMIEAWAAMPATEAETLLMAGTMAAQGDQAAMAGLNDVFSGMAVTGRAARQGVNVNPQLTKLKGAIGDLAKQIEALGAQPPEAPPETAGGEEGKPKKVTEGSVEVVDPYKYRGFGQNIYGVNWSGSGEKTDAPDSEDVRFKGIREGTSTGEQTRAAGMEAMAERYQQEQQQQAEREIAQSRVTPPYERAASKSETMLAMAGVTEGPGEIIQKQEQGEISSQEATQQVNSRIKETSNEATGKLIEKTKNPTGTADLWATKVKGLEDSLNTLRKEISRIQANGDAMAAGTFRSINSGRKISDAQMNRAVARSSEKMLGSQEANRVMGYLNNLAKTGAINNPVYLRRLDPAAAAQADKVLANMAAMEELDLQWDRNKLQWSQWAYQKGLMELQREKQMELNQAISAAGIDPKVLDAVIPEMVKIRQEMVKEGWKQKKIDEFFKKNPDMMILQETMVKLLEQGFGLEISQKQAEMGLIEGMLAGLTGNAPMDYQVTSISSGMPGAAGAQQQGVNSSNVTATQYLGQ